MKKILVTILVVVGVMSGSAQKVEECLYSLNDELKLFESFYVKEGTTLKFQRIIELENSKKTKDQIYYMTKEFIVKNYGDANKVTQLDDKEKGRIIVKGLMCDITCGCSQIVFSGSAMEYTTTHILQIDMKDNRVRITLTLTDIEQKSGGVSCGTTYVPLKYTKFNITDLYPFRTSCTVFSSNHSLGWYPKPGSKMQHKGEIHEGYVMLKILNRTINTLDYLEKYFKTSVPNNLNVDNEEDW